METPHQRKCHDCGHIDTYTDSIIPECLCRKCRSQDTRKVRQPVGTVNDAALHAIEWCKSNPGWQRICDVEDPDNLTLKWEELPLIETRRYWEEAYQDSAKRAWEEWGSHPTRYRKGFVCSDGVFRDYLPVQTNIMMVFQTGGPEGIYYGYGLCTRSKGKPAKATGEER